MPSPKSWCRAAFSASCKDVHERWNIRLFILIAPICPLGLPIVVRMNRARSAIRADSNRRIVGGVILEGLGWRAMFLINLPIGLVAAAMSISLIPRMGWAEEGTAQRSR